MASADLLADGYEIRTIQDLLGDKDVKTTMVYTLVLNRGGRDVRSPLDKVGAVPGLRGPGDYPDRPVGITPRDALPSLGISL